jgi:ESF2/ABP1 family protein
VPEEEDVPEGLTDIHAYNAEKQKRGVVYVSRVPPFMKVPKLRHLLSPYGAIGRIYLVKEDKSAAKRRKKSGGNRKTKFTEGWVEFMDKKVARSVAESLNNTQIGGNKHGFFHDDMWNLKYLPKFKWHHLTEKIAYENQVRQQKLRTEVAQAKRENSYYLDQVDKAKKVEAMKARKSAKGDDSKPQNMKVAEFKQRTTGNAAKRDAANLGDDLLTKILPDAKRQKGSS